MEAPRVAPVARYLSNTPCALWLDPEIYSRDLKETPPPWFTKPHLFDIYRPDLTPPTCTLSKHWIGEAGVFKSLDLCPTCASKVS